MPVQEVTHGAVEVEVHVARRCTAVHEEDHHDDLRGDGKAESHRPNPAVPRYGEQARDQEDRAHGSARRLPTWVEPDRLARDHDHRKADEDPGREQGAARLVAPLPGRPGPGHEEETGGQEQAGGEGLPCRVRGGVREQSDDDRRDHEREAAC